MFGLDDGWQFVVPGYLITFGLIALYVGLTIARAQKLAKQLPEEERRFLD